MDVRVIQVVIGTTAAWPKMLNEAKWNALRAWTMLIGLARHRVSIRTFIAHFRSQRAAYMRHTLVQNAFCFFIFLYIFGTESMHKTKFDADQKTS